MGGFVVAKFYPFGNWCKKAAVPLGRYTDVPACDLPFVVGYRYPISRTTKSEVWRTVGPPGPFLFLESPSIFRILVGRLVSLAYSSR